jgi:hypothetical protein
MDECIKPQQGNMIQKLQNKGILSLITGFIQKLNGKKKKKEERDCLRLKEASESYQLDPHVKFASCFATN